MIVVAQIIKTEAVLFRVDDFFEPVLDRAAKGRIYHAFEYGILNSLSIIYANFGNLAQPLFPRRGLRVHIVSNQYKHMAAYFHKNGG
jgi:hypothetical protein